jgi:hypothetical protein
MYKLLLLFLAFSRLSKSGALFPSTTGQFLWPMYGKDQLYYVALLWIRFSFLFCSPLLDCTLFGLCYRGNSFLILLGNILPEL